MENEPQKTYLDPTTIQDFQEYFIDQAFQFQELIMMYNCAIREVRTKLEVLNDELSMRHQRNPIESITSRIKRPLSIVEKLRRYNVPITVESVEEHLSDVAGIRVICPFIDDIYDVADMLLKQDDITLIKRKDYIQTPKENGYRSLHLIVSVPIFLANEKRIMKAEIQLRTIAMDFWASLEHQLRYKKDIKNPEEISAELKECAEIIAQTDARMLAIKNKIYSENSPADSPVDRLGKLGLPMN